ncbi:MAG: cation transporter, partial [Candidatus Obscuribacterales bacterium]|nr:cation transporter [Candidatus Obscuribacterales bacterium]
VVLGMSGAVALAGLGKYHVYFMAAAILIMLGGGVFIWRRQKACALAGQKSNVLKPLIISFAVFGLFTLGINQVLVPYLSQSGNSQSLAATPSGVELQQAIFAIEGMTCEGCAGTIGTVLSKAPGVQKSSVSFEKKQAMVVYDPAKTNLEKLIVEITKTHYKANLMSKEPFTAK